MSNLSTAVVETIRQQIIQGQLCPGDKLPAESALENEFKVSRTVIREALSRLQTAGLVEKYRGKGTYVLTRPTDHSFSAPLQENQSHQDRLDLLDFRIGIEVETAGLAAQRRSTTQLTAIRTALDAFEHANHKPSAAVTTDFDFHRSIAVAANNRLYLDLLQSLGPTMISMPQTRLLQADQEAQATHFRRVVDEHQAIHDAIERQDPQGSAAAMRTHLSRTRARLALVTTRG
ncbi:GntR family transcriptional repressor for pyruvate dehydrogenase complex [Arthrobacter sp. PL16]|uniref:FadR/GntR family transcriptional regulator n=1 Tax=Arthrobacter sp. PL16 TaxID=3071720 RepID=UPI002DFDDBC0|nr:GntR family transcriptional repressor for pyruvate dehydrogenase complex [Arthrobacter sp. PL16]